MSREGRSLTGSKVILFGEHFVVYNKPAVALPFISCNVEVTIQPSLVDEIQSTLYTGLLHHAPTIFTGLKQLLLKAKETLSIVEPCRIVIDSHIPLQRGMGSSAAISIGIIKAFYDYANVPIDYDMVKVLAQEAENVHHSNASGIDIETILSDSPIRFQRNHPSVAIETDLDAQLLLVDTGILGSTAEAVNYVTSVFHQHIDKKNMFLTAYEDIFLQAEMALRHNDSKTLGKLMTMNHDLLTQLGVSHPKIDSWISYALNHQALGAKITGGGLGGCFLVLSDTTDTTQLLKKHYMQEGLKVHILKMKGTHHDTNS